MTQTWMFPEPAGIGQPGALASPLLSESEEDVLWQFVDRAPVPLLVADDERRVVRVNAVWSELMGYTAESPVALQAVLERLAAQRILRSLDTDEEGRRYEIFHDVLAEPVLEWRRGFEAQAAVERERRRHRRLIAIAVVAAVLAALMAVFSVWAFAQRTEASKQKREAQLQADNAIGQARKAQLLEIQALADKERATKAKKSADLSAARAKLSAPP